MILKNPLAVSKLVQFKGYSFGDFCGCHISSLKRSRHAEAIEQP